MPGVEPGPVDSGQRWGQLQGALLPGAQCQPRGAVHALCYAPDATMLRPPPQVIGLLDVFTPDETLDDFADL